MVTPHEQQSNADGSTGQFEEKVVHTRRISKVVKGGRHLRFNALVVIGDGKGTVGAGLGKSEAIPDAVRKGAAVARKGLVRIPLKESTIPEEITIRYNAARIIIKPAPPGTGVIASGPIRAIMELAGIKDIVAKSLGSRNPINVVAGTLKGLSQLKSPEEEISKRMALVNKQPASSGR
jgi:small subunit ribosomal protein S5